MRPGPAVLGGEHPLARARGALGGCARLRRAALVAARPVLAGATGLLAALRRRRADRDHRRGFSPPPACAVGARRAHRPRAAPLSPSPPMPRAAGSRRVGALAKSLERMASRRRAACATAVVAPVVPVGDPRGRHRRGPRACSATAPRPRRGRPHGGCSAVLAAVRLRCAPPARGARPAAVRAQRPRRLRRSMTRLVPCLVGRARPRRRRDCSAATRRPTEHQGQGLQRVRARLVTSDFDGRCSHDQGGGQAGWARAARGARTRAALK